MFDKNIKVEKGKKAIYDPVFQKKVLLKLSRVLYCIFI